jgi:DNA polymerase zeta
MHEVAMPPDPGKPLPQDVLKTLSLGLEFENKLIELCGDAITSSTVKGNSVGLVHVNPDNIELEALKFSKETEIVGSLSPQGSICEKEDGTRSTEGRDSSPKPLSTNEMQSSAITETPDPKVIYHDLNFLFV